MGKIYNLNEAAYILGVSERTLSSWIHEGKLKARLIIDDDRHYRYKIKESDLEECLCNHTQHALDTINRYNRHKERQRHLEYLDAREEELYSELCIIEQMKRNISRMDL